jgi:hypothetical protein
VLQKKTAELFEDGIEKEAKTPSIKSMATSKLGFDK